jgi:hypothetical protein
MDAFEEVIAELLWEEGYWVRTSFKVNLTKADRKLINNASSPRPEIDIVAYSGQQKILRIVECKSFLDSAGVRLVDLKDKDSKGAKRYKIFHNSSLRDLVFQQVRKQLSDRGLCPSDVQTRLCLVCGRIPSRRDREGLIALAEKQGWDLLDDVWVHERLAKLKDRGYENQVSTVVAKILLRNR